MKQRTLLIVGVSLLLIGALGLLGSLALERASAPGDRRLRANGRARSVDAMFIQQMIPHHQDAIDMSELAIERAGHPEIRELAQTIKRSQSAENEQMRGWYEEWFGAAVPDAGRSGMRGPMMGGGTDLERLRNADDFDREFIQQMVPHHQMAIMMARMAGRSTRRAEMQDLTDSIIETQSREIRDMQRWHEDWYGG